MRLESGRDPLHDEAIKHHEQNEKDYDKAMKENKDGVNLVSGDNTKKKDGKVKSSQLKKMHLSEDLFVDMFEPLQESLDNPDLKQFKSEILKVVMNTCVKYLDSGLTRQDIEEAVEYAKSFIFDDEEDALDESIDYDLYNPDTWELDESVDLDESEDFLDKVAKKVMGESLEEKKTLNEENDFQSGYDIANIIQQNYPKGVDIYNVVDDGPYYTVEFEIDDGDWKHEHLAFKYWMEQNAAELTDCDVKFGGSETLGDSDSDTYSATHTYYFIPNESYNEEPSDIEDSEEQDIESNNDETSDVPEGDDEIGFDDDSIEMEESLKFNVAREQLKRFNENKMPSNWSPQVYLERLVKRNHITESQKKLLEETYLVK